MTPERFAVIDHMMNDKNLTAPQIFYAWQEVKIHIQELQDRPPVAKRLKDGTIVVYTSMLDDPMVPRTVESDLLEDR